MKRFLPFTKQKHSLKALFFLLLLASLVLFAFGAMAQAPSVSCTGPHGYTVGSPITPLSPANMGGAVAVTYNGSPQAISLAYSGTQQLAQGLAVDNKGNMYATDFANGHQILEYTNGQVIQLASGFNQPGGIAVDKAGNVYFTDRTAVYKMAPGGTAVVIAAFKEADSMAIDADGNLYVADQGDGTGNLGGLFKMNNDGSNKTLIDADQQYPRLVAVDSTGEVFTYSALTQTLYKYAAGSLQKTVVSTSIQNAECLASDKNGNIYIGSEVSIPFSSGVNNNIYFISSGGGAPQLLVTVGLTNATSLAGVATDAANNLYILYVNINHLDEVDIYARTGGYSVSPALPAGLVLDNNTGIISGTPTATSPAISYTVTALNSSGSSTTNITIQVGSPPAISYGAAQTYNQKTAISPLTPSNSGAAVTTAGYSTAPAIVAAGFAMPAGITADASGNIYVADKINNTIQEITSSGGNPASIGSAFNGPAGIAADAAGNLYVADSGNGAVKEIPQGNGAMQTLVSGLTVPQYITRDAAGNLFVANSTAIYEIASGSGTATTLVTGFSNLTGISIDSNGNLYISGQGKVYKMKVGNNTPLDLGLSIAAPAGVVVDASGNLLITDSNTHALYAVAAGGTTATVLTAGFTTPAAVSAGADGKIYISDPGAGKAFELSPTGGFYLNQSLPQGLVMDPNTGAISGTPKTQSAAASYTVSAYSGLVSGSSPLTIGVGPPLGAPAISYQNPPAYVQGAAITPLSPVNAGGTVNVSSWSAPVPFGPNFAQHWGLAVDSKGNVFVCDAAESANQGVIEIPANGGATIRYGNSSNDDAVAVDSTGNVYFVHSGALFHATRGNGSVTPFGPQSLSNLVDVAVDPAGNIYVLDFFAQTIHRITPDGNSETQIGSIANGANAPFAIAADAFGNVYMGNQGDHTIKEIPAAGGSTITLATGITPVHLAVDNAGNIYEADNSGVVNRVPAGGGALATIVNSGGYGIAVDGAGNLYSADANDGQIAKVTPAGGYFISRCLPRGLSINDTTGIISGTPITATAGAAYTVTAYNSNGSSSANIILATGQPPAISYTGTQAYTVGTAISALSPVNSGAAVSVPGYSTLSSVFAGGLGSPQQIASDAMGNLYVADKSKNMITKIPAGGGAGVCIGGGFNKPSGVAVDKAGNVYVADAGNAAVKEIPAAGGFISTIGTGFTAPAAVAIDTLGNIYVADMAAVYKITPGGVQTQLIAGFNSLSAIAVSPGGKLVYVADSGAGKVYQITDTGTPAYSLSIGGTFNSPAGIARDNFGNLFVSDASRQLYEILNGQDTQAISLGLSLSGASAPAGLLVDATGNIYFGDAGTGQINKVALLGGYYPGTPLPEGLVLDNTAGTISGTPKSVTASANYTITAYAAGVPGQAVVNISTSAVQSAPVLKYSVSPEYAAGLPITPLQPLNTGGAVDPNISYNGTPRVFGTGVTPFGRIVYGYNNTIFVADKLDASIAAIFQDGSASRLASFLYQPNGIAVDNTGGIWIADNQNVREIDYGGSDNAFIVADGSFQVPTSIAADAHGDIFVGDLGLAGVYRMHNDGTNIVKIDNGITHPDALASDAAGNVYAVSSTANALYEIPADGSAQITVATFTQPTDVALDPDGNIAVATNDGHIYMILASGGAPFLVRQSTFANISGLTFDANGALYVGQSTSPGISQLNLTGSFKAVSLPAGISVNRATGVITGTAPSNPFPGQFIFNVSGYNLDGSSTYTVFINTTSGPSFSYNSPTTFYKGVATALSPQNGSSVYPSGYYDNNLTVIASGFNNPRGVAVDTAGNVYVADQGNNVVKKILPGSSTPVCVGTGFNSPAGLAIDNAGNIYVSDAGNGLVKEIPAAGGQIQIIASGFTSLQALAIDQAGNLYAGDDGNKAIYKIAAGTRTKSLVINTGFSVGIASIAVDANGALYTADSNPNVQPLIYKLPAGSGSLTPLTSIESVISPESFLVDPCGNFFFLEDAGVQIFELRPGDEFYTDAATGWAGNAGGMALDGTGSFMIASGNKLYKLSPSGGFYLNKALPNGLVFNQNSGLISGTPQAVSPATNYTITGYNNNVAAAAAVNLSVAIPSPDATLANLAVDGNTISPAFDPSTLSYNATVDWSAASATVTPTVDNAGAAVTVDGQAVSSETSSQSLPLAYGNNTVTVKVTAQDAVTTRTYTITINRQLAPETITFSPLSSATYGDADITPGATSDNSGVAITYSSDKASVATIVNGNIHIAGAGTANITAAQAGDATHKPAGNVVQPFTVSPAGLIVTADSKSMIAGQQLPTLTASYNGFVNGDGSGNLTTQPQLTTAATSSSAPGQYTISAGGATASNYDISYVNGLLTINASNDASLSGISLSAGQLNPAFNASTTTYTINVANNVSAITITPATNNANAGVTIDGNSPATPVSLAVGQKVILVVVTAQDGTQQTYSVTVTRAPSTNDNLVSLKMSKGIFSPAFSNGITNYTDAVGNAITSVTVTPTTADPTATVKVNGATVSSGIASGPITLNVGANPIYAAVTAQDGTTTKTDTITVTRAPSTNDNLVSLKMSKGIFSPAFATATTRYADAVGNTIASVTVTPTAADPAATVKVNGATVSSGIASGPITLNIGPNPIYVAVTAQNGTTKTDTITVTRAPSTNDNLASLKMSKGIFSPAFATNNTRYTDAVGNAISSVMVTPTTADPTAMVKVNGATVSSGTPSDPVNLNFGPNAIYVTVTAQDGISKTDTVTVIRPALTNGNLTSLKMSKGIFSPAFATTTTSYRDAVGNTITSVTVTPTTADPAATVKVNGTTVTSGTASDPINLAVGATPIYVAVTAQDGTTTKTDTVTVTRAPGGADSYIQGISVTKPFGAGVQNFEPLTLDDGIQVHQGVSPNGDGINDFLMIDNISQCPDNKLSIMNRNGQLIYEAQGYDNSSKVFDGHSNKNGQMQLPGTYFYQLDYTVNGIAKHKAGFIVLKY